MMTTYGRKLHPFEWITAMFNIAWIDHLSIRVELALITKLVQGAVTRTFEYGLWELTSGKRNII